jgi:hypothetical protein
VATKSFEEILAEIRALPLADRLKVIERASHEVAEDTPPPSAVERRAPVPNLFGLMEDEPELVDEVCALAYEMRAEARPRATDG